MDERNLDDIIALRAKIKNLEADIEKINKQDTTLMARNVPTDEWDWACQQWNIPDHTLQATLRSTATGIKRAEIAETRERMNLLLVPVAAGVKPPATGEQGNQSNDNAN